MQPELRSPSSVGLTAILGFRVFAATVRGFVSEPRPALLQNKRRASFPHHSRDHIGNLQSPLLVAAARAAARTAAAAVRVVVVAVAVSVVVVAVAVAVVVVVVVVVNAVAVAVVVVLVVGVAVAVVDLRSDHP